MNDRSSYENFVRLRVMNSTADSTTIAFLRERIQKAAVIEEHFEIFESYLNFEGLQARDGRIIDKTLAPEP